MESEEEDDSNSLLSLSQSLLQPDNSSSISLSTNQMNSWSSSVVEAAGDMVNHFSPVSPADSYNSQVLSNNDDSFTRFYNFRSTSGNQQSNKSCSFIRMDSSSIPIDSSFPSSSSSRLSTNDFSHTGNSGNHGNMYFDQTLDSRNSESYSIKEPEGTFRNSALGQYDHIAQTRLDSSSKANVTNFSHSESYNNIMNINLVSDSEGKLDIFEQRTRQNDYVKDVDSLYEQSVNKSALKGVPNTDMLASLDRRHMEAPGFDNDLDDFPSSTREFTASSSKLDGGSVSRVSQQVTFHHQQGGFDNLCQTPSSHKHSSIMTLIDGESQLINPSLSAESNPKRIPVSSCFGNSSFNENEFTKQSTSSQKKPSYIPLTELPDFEPVFHGEFSGNHKLSPESHMSFYASDTVDDKHVSKMQRKSSVESKDSINKWSGRPRAHRKMARLLGSDLIKESFHEQESDGLEKSYSKSSNDCIPQCKNNSYQSLIQNDFASSGRAFLTMDEELDLRTGQQQDRHFLRRDESLPRHQVAQREMGFMHSAAFSLDSSALSSSLPKDSMNNMLPGQQFIMPAHLDLDFHSSLSVGQPPRDVDLSQHFGLQTVSKTFETDQVNGAGGQEIMSFEQQNLQHINQQDLSLPDHLGLVSHNSQDLNLDAYFMAPNEKEVSFVGRKCASQIQRDNAESDFNIEEFMNHKDIGQSYFERTELPQDMTLYQKSDKQVVVPEIPVMHKDRIRGNQSCVDKQSEISELQKELTKTSTKESMKGIRTPRDINRALEIFQGLQQNEREEERRKEHQLRQQQYQSLAAGASPKKTFHNKHLVEQMGISVQPFLGQSSQFMEDQSVNNFLDQSHLIMNDPHPNGNLMLTQYQQNKKDALGAYQSEGDTSYHSGKKLPSLMKDFVSGQSTSMFLNQHSNLASMLTTNSAVELPFSDSAPLQFQNQQSEIDGLANKFASYSGLTGAEALTRKVVDSGTTQSDNVANRVKVTDANTQVSDDIFMSREQEDILMSSRKSLYVMMTREEFCDAVLSTPKQTVKIHQAVLCSVSQYLSTLLLNMKPNPSMGTTGCAPASPSSFYFSQSLSNQGVLLLVNCDEIKPSSISAFLMFIYLGKAEFSESNVQDLYMLACSLKVTSLEDLCKKFMWSTQMSDDHIKVPQLLVFSRKSETRDQSSMAELGAVKLFEDKCISTAASNVKYMEASTQTDRSTTEAGGGGQEEWVMLKKTKQKTVSPSKSRLLIKASQGSESPSTCKVGKKGWLSPKKHKVESHTEGQAISVDSFLGSDNISYSKVTVFQPTGLKEKPNTPNQDAANVNSNKIPCFFEQTADKPVNADFNQGCQKLIASASPESQNIPVKHQRTTVEIAAAAAAAKLSAHSYGTRLARGHGKSPVSYAVLASLQEKKKFMIQKEKSVTAVSKKKDFIKSNPSVDFSISSNTKTDIAPAAHGALERNCGSNIHHDTMVAEPSKLSVKRPIKKSIVHRTQSDEVLKNTFTLNPCGSKDNSLEVNGKSDLNPGLGSEYLDTNVGHVSTLIDSFVNSIEPENVDVDFQKVISDLDRELNRSPLLATATSSSSVSSTSLASPLKSPQLSLPTSESSSPFKIRSTPQGFRKRLIHMINSENNTFLQSTQSVCQPGAPSSDSYSDRTPPSAAVCSTVAVQSNRDTAIPPHLDTNISAPETPFVNNGCVVEKISLANSLLSSVDEQTLETPIKQTPENFLNIDDIEQSVIIMPEEASEVSSFSLMTDRDLGLNDQSQSFHHKIFKRKKKNKIRKSTVLETEINTAKAKKLTSEIENSSSVKPRHKKVTGSDSEGGGGNRPKMKKASTDRPETQANVRPPPKKRAKMELELLKAASEVKTSRDCAVVTKKKIDLETLGAYEKVDDVKESVGLSKEKEKMTALGNDSEVNLKSTDLTVIKKKQKKNVGLDVKKALIKSMNDTGLSINGTDTVILEETKLTLLLEGKAKKESVKNQFTCTLCQSQFRSARRTVKHMFNHGTSGKELLDLITVGPNEERGACNVCGYKTKDQSYHYMHYHKYFKHGIPLPMGWKADRCEICGKECFTKFQLKEHMETHKDTKGYICWVCGQSFKSRNCFNSHVFHKHNDVRKYECKVCEKSFKTWTQLKVHVRSHTGDKPFSCIECDYRSTTQGNMKLHLVTHGLDKEQIKEVMERITKDVPEMTPESLNHIMEDLAKKAPAVKKSDKPSPRKKSPKCQPKENSEVKVKTETGMTKSSKMMPLEQKVVSPLTMLAGPEQKQMFDQSLSRWEPPKVMLSLTNYPPTTTGMTTEDENKSSIQVNQSRNESDLNRLVEVGSLTTLLQAQHQQPSMQMPAATTYFIPLSSSDQNTQLQQSTSSKSPILSYTTIPTFLYSGPPGLQTTLDPSSILTMTDLSGSGLGVVPHTIQIVQPKTAAHHSSQDVMSSGVNVLGSFNFPISEYTVIASDADNCDSGTVTLEIDLQDQHNNVVSNRFLVEDDKGGFTEIGKAVGNSENVNITAATSLGSVLYVECNSEEQERVNITLPEMAENVEIGSPMIMIVKKESSESEQCKNMNISHTV